MKPASEQPRSHIGSRRLRLLDDGMKHHLVVTAQQILNHAPAFRPRICGGLQHCLRRLRHTETVHRMNGGGACCQDRRIVRPSAAGFAPPLRHQELAGAAPGRARSELCLRPTRSAGANPRRCRPRRGTGSHSVLSSYGAAYRLSAALRGHNRVSTMRWGSAIGRACCWRPSLA